MMMMMVSPMMMMILSLLLLLLSSHHIQPIHAEASTTTSSNDHNDDTPQECGLYLAISSTSTVDDTNWGLFVGQDIDGYHHPIGNPEIGIIVSNLRLHNEPTIRTSSTSSNDTPPPTTDEIRHMKLVDYFEAFFWVPATAGAKYYFDTTKTDTTGERAIAAISGPGVLASYSKHMTNSDWDHRTAYMIHTTTTYPPPPPHPQHPPEQQEVETQVSHPNRGAISSYHNCQIRTTVQTIKTGTEVFMEYGDSWADKQNEEDELTKDDYDKMDQTVAQMIAFFHKYNDTVLDDDSRLEIYSFLMKDIMKAAVGPTKARRISSILPPNPHDLHLVPAAGGVQAYSDPAAHRSVSFLQKYGLCMDHIYPAPSTIPHIGRGAFAKRPIPSGSMVVPIPLTHVADRSIFNMYPLTTDPDTGKLKRSSDTVLSQQLIVNYCFGHPESTMVFFPSGSMTTLINHSKEPNAKLQWSTHPNHQKLWYDFDPHTTLMEEEYMYMGLILEVVALRDIAPDEEIFMDYGTEWQTAYDTHVETWNRKIQEGILPKVWPIRANDLNAQFHTIDTSSSSWKPFPTIDEANTDESLQFPSNVMIMAFLLVSDTDNVGTMDDPKLWNHEDPQAVYTTEHLFEIRIVGRTAITKDKDNGTGSTTTTTTYSYTVQWESSSNNNDDDTTTTTSVKKMVVVDQVPHEAIVFVDRPGTNDQQYLHEHSFRHIIGIPDDIFPRGPWRNVAQK